MNLRAVESYWLHPADMVRAMVRGEGEDFDRVSRLLQIPRGTGTAVCVGSGVGYEPFILMSMGYETTALDLNWSTLHASQYLWPGPDYVWTDVLDWQPKTSPKIVVCIGTLEHVFDMSVVLAHMASWGAERYYVSVPIGMDKNPWHLQHFLNKDDVFALLGKYWPNVTEIPVALDAMFVARE